jgi:hypothetical protein
LFYEYKEALESVEDGYEDFERALDTMSQYL